MIEEAPGKKIENSTSPDYGHTLTQEATKETQTNPFFKRALEKAKASLNKPTEMVSKTFASKVMTEATLPTDHDLGYKSKVGMFGGKLIREGDRLVFRMTGSISKLDKWGDKLLRTYDEHTVKEPLKLLRRSRGWALRAARPFQPKRYRGNVQEIAQNIERLNLAEYYAPVHDGIEIKKPEVFTSSPNLYDIYMSDTIGSELLDQTDRFQALKEASRYLSEVHISSGAVGEVLTNEFFFQGNENGRVSQPVLNIPDIVWNPEKYDSDRLKSTEPKATDLLDFLASVGMQEIRRSNGDLKMLDKAMEAVLKGYQNATVIRATKSLALRGRLTLPGDASSINLPPSITRKIRGFLSVHNNARLGANSTHSAILRGEIVKNITNFLGTTEPKTANENSQLQD
ncbi:MAG: hypothetical protein AAB512_00645 [Patescibacteria group bacterium]